MSRLATLPGALRIESWTDGEMEPIEGTPYIDVADAKRIYAVDTDVIVEISQLRSWRFCMADETAACEGVETLAKIAARG